MKKLQIAACALGLSATVALTAAAQHKWRQRSRNVSTNSGQVSDCSDLRVSFGDRRWGYNDVVRAEQAATLPVTAGRALAVEASRNGGAYVLGGSRAEYDIVGCFFATGDTRAEAETLLRKLALNARDGRASVSGPEERDWVGFLIVRAPRGAAVDLRGWNGPLEVRGVNGRVTVEAHNGPVSLEDTSGEVEVRAENGPVHISGAEGKFTVRLQNGPLHVELSGTRWQSGGIEASTQNGPIHLEVPRDYQSGVLVDVSRHSPVQCTAPQCRQAVRTWERPNRIEFGGPPVVRLSTVNGPVTVSGAQWGPKQGASEK